MANQSQLLRRVSLQMTVMLTFIVLAAHEPNAWGQTSQSAPSSIEADPFVWLEQVDDPHVMQWVRGENAKTLGRLERDPLYPQIYKEAVDIAEAKDRIPTPKILGGVVYNFWQDTDHIRGQWRTTTLSEFRADKPAWTTILDLDALASGEKANWVWKGSICLQPDESRCLVKLSDGGEDAESVREFDLKTRQFVPGGFQLPKSKQSSTWIDQDDLLIARDWGSGTLTASGYPFVVKTLKRGAALNEAHEVFRGKVDDVAVELHTLSDGEDHRAVLIERGVTFFQTEHFVLNANRPIRLNVPLKSEVVGLVAGNLIFSLEESWVLPNKTIPPGALVAVGLQEALADPAHLKPYLIYSPGPRESVSEVAATRGQLVVTSYDNVRGRAGIYTPQAKGSWRHQALALPDNSSISITATNLHGEEAFLEVTGFLAPTTLWQADASNAQLTQIKQLPAKFDAADLVVEQHEATSKDGTRIPYFLVHSRSMKLDGQNPLIMEAYGGFQVSETPEYLPDTGKIWLSRGGAYVLANIRGGGEFGPAWHEAGLKTNRQRIYDDFSAVADDLVATRVTSPRRFGIEGASNGGLLMGVEFTQHPEKWNAVDIQVPLLDMLRYEKIAAGASWVGEYGSVSNPEERAFLASISPFNNVKAGIKYPEPLIWTTTKDDRVGPQHARKFAAKLSALGVPYLFYEVIEGGHAAGANLKERAHTTALEMTYFIEKLMHPAP